MRVLTLIVPLARGEVRLPERGHSVYKIRSHSVRDMSFRKVPEVQLTYRFSPGWEFAATAKTLAFSMFQDLEGLFCTEYKDSCQLSAALGRSRLW